MSTADPTGRRPLGRATGRVLTVLGLALAMLAAAAVLVPVGRPADGTPLPGRGAVSDVVAAGSSADLSTSAEALQTRLRRLPEDWTAWASLGAVYVAQAQASADPTYYGKAEDALRRSLRLHPKDNDAALTGLASLAAARHDFARARDLAQRALDVNPYDSTALGLLSDALIELGRYDRGFAAVQRMLNLKPGVPSFARASYTFELRGDIKGARIALQRALDVAYSSFDTAFALRYLAELAWNNGDLQAASGYVQEGLTQEPGAVPLLAVRARLLAARGNVQAALSTWAEVVSRLPQPSYLIEYGDLLSSLGRHAEAARQYGVADATLELFQAQGADVDLELALFAADRGRVRQAVSAARAQWELRRSVHVEDAYAWALHAAGRDKEALAHAHAAARLGTRSALFAYHRGMIEAALGRESAARQSLRAALRINPYFSPLHAPRAVRTLAQLSGRP